jgi:hypothetical protein
MNEALYVNVTQYDTRALTALNDLAERSVRKESSQRTRRMALLMGLLGLVLGAVVYPMQSTVGSLLLLYGVLLLLLVMNWKSFQLRSSRRQLQHGVKTCTYTFTDEEIICETEAATLRYAYDQTFAVVANQDWYALFFDTAHGVVLDKSGFTQGDPLMFKSFIGQHTMLPIQEF